MNIDLIGYMDTKRTERQNRLETIEKLLETGSYQNGSIKAEYRTHGPDKEYGGVRIENDIFFNSEVFSIASDLETAAELVYFLEHVLKHQK